MALGDEVVLKCQSVRRGIVFLVLTASITSEVKNDHDHVTTQRFLNKFIEVNFFVGCMDWPWCCLFQPQLPCLLLRYTIQIGIFKGGFKSEDTGEFLHCQNKYSKSLSWAENLNFPPKIWISCLLFWGGKFKFFAQDNDLEYSFWQCKSSPVSSDLKSPLEIVRFILNKMHKQLGVLIRCKCK